MIFSEIKSSSTDLRDVVLLVKCDFRWRLNSEAQHRHLSAVKETDEEEIDEVEGQQEQKINSSTGALSGHFGDGDSTVPLV